MADGIKPVSDRKRSRETHEAALAATGALLAEHGVAGVTIERISAASGVSTATIYKHWPSKTAVVAEAFGTAADAALPLPHSGDPLADLVDFAVASMTFHSPPSSRVFTQLLASCAMEASGAAYLQEYYMGPRRRAIRPLWDRAAAAGVVRHDIDADFALDILFGAAVFRLMRGIHDTATDTLRETIELSLRGLITQER